MEINVPEMELRVKQGLIKKFISKDNKYVGWCYTQKTQYDQLWDEHTIIARGIVTLPDGTVISRPFTKFFNLGDPRAEPIPWNEEIEITEKIDGSLIICNFHDGKIIVNSKGSFTSDHAVFARNWIDNNLSEWKHIREQMLEDGEYTYLFEAVFPETDNCKVIRYGDRADLTLLAIIHVETGKEFTYDKLKEFGDTIGVNVTPRYDTKNIRDLISDCKARSIRDGEGIVLHFLSSGKRVKVKSDEYLRLTRLISHTSKKHILESMINGDNAESIYGALPDELFQDVKNTMMTISTHYEAIHASAHIVVTALKEISDKKDRAIRIESSPELSELKPVIYAMLNGKDESKPIWNIIKKTIKEAENKE